MIAAYEGGHIIGVLPLLHIKTGLGNYLTSMPGGLISDSPQAADNILAFAKTLVKDLQARYLVLRDSKLIHNDRELITDQNHFSMVVSLEHGPEEVQKNISRKTKQITRNAYKSGIHSVVDNKHLIEYYPVYLRAMREKGTPTQGFKFFKNAIEEYPDRFKLIVIFQDRHILGGGFIFDFRYQTICTWAGLREKYLPINAGYAFYMDTIQEAIHQGKQTINLGRSYINSGTYQYKLKWGAKPEQLYQQYYLHRRKNPPVTGGHRNGKFAQRMVMNVWQHIPDPIAERIGPVIRRQIPFG
jgi:lipid II:glycine glycyltransferase (peptidoglycan interpeptide bridge formation enzyme)